MATDWLDLLGKSLPALVSAGGALWNYSNNKNVSGDLAKASTSPQVDAFGAQNRAFYQQKLANLYKDPNGTLENLPGYQFALNQGIKGVNREAAKTGHYISTNRLYGVADYTTGLAQQTLASERDALMKLSGSQFGPDGSSYADLQGSRANVQGGQPGVALGGVTDLLKSPLGDAGIDAGFDWLKDRMGNPESGSEAQSAQEGASSTFSGEDAQAQSSTFAGEDALSNLSPFVGPDAAMSGTGMGAVGTNQLAGLGLNNISDVGTASQQLAATGPMGAGAYAPDMQQLTGLNSALARGPVGTPATLTDAYNGYTNMTAGATTGGMVGGAGGGMLGSYLGSKIPGIGTDSPIGGFVGGVAGTAAGAYGGAVIGGASTAAGTGAAGMSAAGASAMAVAGPAAIAAAAYIVGSGIYGMAKSASAKDQRQDESRTSLNDWWSGGLVDDPTGQNLGKGWIKNFDGTDMFMPKKSYQSMFDKMATGSYGDYGTYGMHQATNYGGIGYVNMGGDQGWQSGLFAGSGADTWDPYKSFHVGGAQEAQKKYDDYLMEVHESQQPGYIKPWKATHQSSGDGGNYDTPGLESDYSWRPESTGGDSAQDGGGWVRNQPEMRGN